MRQLPAARLGPSVGRVDLCTQAVHSSPGSEVHRRAVQCSTAQAEASLAKGKRGLLPLGINCFCIFLDLKLIRFFFCFILIQDVQHLYGLAQKRANWRKCQIGGTSPVA